MRRAAGVFAKRSLSCLTVSHERVLIRRGSSAGENSATWRTILSSAKGSNSDARRWVVVLADIVRDGKHQTRRNAMSHLQATVDRRMPRLLASVPARHDPNAKAETMLARVRMACGLTQEELADAIGISLPTYRRLERKDMG
jgi:hypothetical protein